MNLISKKIANLPPSSIRVIFEKAKKMTDVIRLEIGEPDFVTPNHIREAAKEALDEGFTHYTSFSGIKELRLAIAEKMDSENAVEVDPNREIVVTPGACSAIFCSILSLVNPGEKVLVPDPGWPHYAACIRIAGGIPEGYLLSEENDFRLDPADLIGRINKKTKAVIINSPNNPTGSVLTKKDLMEIAQIAIDNNLIVISDEVYEKIIYDGAEHICIASLPQMNERTITISGLSKTYAMTGWRIGYAIGPEEVITQMNKLVLYSSTCANSIGQRAAISALNGPQEPVVTMRNEYKNRRDYIIKRLKEIPHISCKSPDGAFYVFPNIMECGMSSFDFADFLLDHARVATVPGSGFGTYGEGYIRISYATSQKNIEIGLNRIEKALRSIKVG